MNKNKTPKEVVRAIRVLSDYIGGRVVYEKAFKG